MYFLAYRSLFHSNYRELSHTKAKFGLAILIQHSGRVLFFWTIKAAYTQTHFLLHKYYKNEFSAINLLPQLCNEATQYNAATSLDSDR